MYKRTKTMIDDMYVAICGAKSKPDVRGFIGAIKKTKENFVYDLACFGAETGFGEALITLLDIAPNYYFENEAICAKVDKFILDKDNEDSALALHLDALRKQAIAIQKNSDPNKSTEENNNLVKDAICKKNLYSGIMNSLQAQIAELGQTYSGGRRMEEKIAQYEQAKAIYDANNSIQGIAEVEGAFAKAREAYLEEAKGAGIEEKLICNANAHLIREEFNLPVQESGVLFNMAELYFASNFSKSLALKYYYNECALVDKYITNAEYTERLKEASTKFSPTYVDVLKKGDLVNLVYNEPRYFTDADVDDFDAPVSE